MSAIYGRPGVIHLSFAGEATESFWITETQNHRITLEETSVDHLVQPPCQSRVTYSRLHRTLSRQVLNISREEESTPSLGSLFQCSVTLRGKKFFLMFRRNFLCFSLCSLPLVLSLGTTEKSLAPSSWHPPFRYLEAFIRSSLSLFFFRLNKPSSLSLSS